MENLVGGFSSISFNIYFYYIDLSILISLPIIAIFKALAIRLKSFGIIVLLSSIFTIIGFTSAYQYLKIIGLSFLAIEANNFRFISPQNLLELIVLALGEVQIFLYLANKFLKYEIK